LFQTLLARGAFLEQTVERRLQNGRLFGGVVAALAAGYTFRWALTTFSVPTVGPDYGHYLIAANWYVGLDRSGEGPFDPPLVPLVIAAFRPLFGRIAVLQALGPVALASTFIAAVFFLNSFIPRWASLAAATVFVHWATFLEFISFGGVTNLFGITLSLVFFRLWYDSLAHPRSGWTLRPPELGASLVLFLVASTHHFTSLIVIAITLTWLAAHLTLGTSHRRATLSTAARILLPGAALGSLYLPYYLQLVATDAQSGLGQPTSPPSLAAGIAYAWQDDPVLWAAFLVLGALTVGRFRRTTPLLPASLAMSLTPLALIVTILASHPVRPLFFLSFPLVFLAALWLSRSDTSWNARVLPTRMRTVARIVCAGLLAVSLLILPGSSEARQWDAIGNYHQFMTGGMLGAFNWIDANTSQATVFAVDASTSPAFNDEWKGMATGWWLEGYANRRAIYEANLPLLPFSAKWEDARDANRLFAGETVFEDGLLRVADSFPFDDAASPKIYTGYYGDFHEFVGFAVPRLINSSSGEDFTLVLGAQREFLRGLSENLGTISGNYSGPNFTGTRLLVYNASSVTTTLHLELNLSPGAVWNSIDMTIRTPPWTSVDLARLAQGTVGVGVPDVLGYALEKGQISFISSNLSSPFQVAPLGKPGETGVGLRWGVLGRRIGLTATVAITVLPTTGPPRHPPFLRTSEQILADRGIGFLFVTQDSASNVQRFDRQPGRFTRIFSNDAAVIYRVGRLLGSF
jgi:hypothetical protein